MNSVTPRWTPPPPPSPPPPSPPRDDVRVRVSATIRDDIPGASPGGFVEARPRGGVAGGPAGRPVGRRCSAPARRRGGEAPPRARAGSRDRLGVTRRAPAVRAVRPSSSEAARSQPALVRFRPDSSEARPSLRPRTPPRDARAGHKAAAGSDGEGSFSVDGRDPRLGPGPSDPRTLGAAHRAALGRSRAARPPRTRTARRARSSRGGSRQARFASSPSDPRGSARSGGGDLGGNRRRRAAGGAAASFGGARPGGVASPRRTFLPDEATERDVPVGSARLFVERGAFHSRRRRDSWCRRLGWSSLPRSVRVDPAIAGEEAVPLRPPTTQ